MEDEVKGRREELTEILRMSFFLQDNKIRRSLKKYEKFSLLIFNLKHIF